LILNWHRIQTVRGTSWQSMRWTVSPIY